MYKNICIDNVMTYRDNVVDVEVVLPPVCLLIPHHRVLKALHRPVQLVEVLLLRPNSQSNLIIVQMGI